MRWPYRIGPYISLSYRTQNTQPAQFISTRKSASRALQPLLIGPSWQRVLCPALRRTISSSRIIASQAEQKPQDTRHDSRDDPKPQKKRSSLSYVIIGGGILAAAVATLLWSSGVSGQGSDGGDDIINKSSFSAFTITSKEQVSPTAFILTVRSRNRSSSSSNGSNGGGGGGSARIREAWTHGLWSVEIKQPQLQIARHYTPLPPPDPDPDSDIESEHHDDDDNNNELRFLIRKLDGGEMSSYLSRLRVGDAVWLRGPHLGFDVARRLGDDAGRSVVFLAGGTGVAPALQVAHRLLLLLLLDDDGDNGGGKRDTTLATATAASDKPVVSILWANRRAVDALGRPPLPLPTTTTGMGFWGISRWWKRGAEEKGDSGGDETTVEQLSSLARQIHEMEKRYPDNFRVRYFVDEEKSFLGAADVVAAAVAPWEQMLVPQPGQRATPPAKECPWHSTAALEKLPNDDDASRRIVGGGGGSGSGSNIPDSTCPCVRTPDERAGVNLLFVSGPDGFIEAYAGPKRWHEGGEMQGPVRGLVGQLTNGRGALDGWLVLKL